MQRGEARIRGRRGRLWPALATMLLVLVVLTPGIWSVPEHPDEDQYVYSAAHYGRLAARLDFSETAQDGEVSWSPFTYWPLTQPMGARLVYALALGITGAPGPAQAWNFVGVQPPAATLVPGRTLLLLRLVAILCAALGLGCVALRFGWRGTAAAALMLAIPHARPDLTRAWAEGPLMLGMGLCVLAYGTRWFGRAAGLAATFKLTALGLWPLLLWPAAHGRARRWAVSRGMLSAVLLWCVLTPSSWFAGGPIYLAAMIVHRQAEYAGQSTAYADGGWFFPTRYWLPVELAGALVLTCGTFRLWQWWTAHREHPAFIPAH